MEGLLRALAPQALAVLARRYGDFADAEDAVQEALPAAPSGGRPPGSPTPPLAGSSRRLASDGRQLRRDEARRRREEVAASRSKSWDAASGDDSLAMLFLCCDPSLRRVAVALTLRAVGGFTTKEIAAAYLVPEATMAQRISRAKRSVAAVGRAVLAARSRPRRSDSAGVCGVYLIFNEGYASCGGPDLWANDLAGEALRLAGCSASSCTTSRVSVRCSPSMLLHEARRPARTARRRAGAPSTAGPLALGRALIAEGQKLVEAALVAGRDR